MNLKMELSKKQQNLMEQLNISIQDKEYTQEELKSALNTISDYIMNLSIKNNDLSNEMAKYNELTSILVKNIVR